MGLSSLLANAAAGSTSDDQGAWRQFILDHLDYIKNRSKVYTIEPDAMYRYQYDVKRFLYEKLQVQQDIGWIFLILNYLPNEFAFDTPGDFYIPTDDLIVSLKHSYMTVTNNPIK